MKKDCNKKIDNNLTVKRLNQTSLLTKIINHHHTPPYKNHEQKSIST